MGIKVDPTTGDVQLPGTQMSDDLRRRLDDARKAIEAQPPALRAQLRDYFREQL